MSAGANNDLCLSLSSFDLGHGPRLLVGGNFFTVGSISATGLFPWTGSAWSPLGSGADAIVRALLPVQEGGQAVLYAGGDFTSVGEVTASHIARWDGAAWNALGAGVTAGIGTPTTVSALVRFN